MTTLKLVKQYHKILIKILIIRMGIVMGTLVFGTLPNSCISDIKGQSVGIGVIGTL